MLLFDLGLGMKELRNEMKAMRDEMKAMRKDMNHGFNELTLRVEKLEKQQQRTNAELSEIRLTFIQYADTIEKTPQLEKRLHRLERIVLK